MVETDLHSLRVTYPDRTLPYAAENRRSPPPAKGSSLSKGQPRWRRRHPPRPQLRSGETRARMDALVRGAHD